jgi:hypothetical protein
MIHDLHIILAAASPNLKYGSKDKEMEMCMTLTEFVEKTPTLTLHACIMIK